MDQWHYFSGSALFVLLAASLLPLFPAFQSTFIKIANNVDSLTIIQRIKSRPSIFHTILLGAAAIIFWGFRQATHFLGDGYLWINHIDNGNLLKFWDLVVIGWLYRQIYNLINADFLSFSADSATVSAIISVGSGLVFLIFAYKTVRILSTRKREQYFLFLAILSSGSMLLFFGYIEAYPPLMAGTMAYLYYGLQYLRQRSGMRTVLTAYLVAFLLHPTLIALLPSLLLLIWFRTGRPLKIGKYYIIISSVIAAGLATLLIFQKQRLFLGFFYNKFLPFFNTFSSNRVPYSLFSFNNLFDVLNELLLICPICIFLPAIFFQPPKKEHRFDRRIILFLGTGVIFYILEFCIVNKLIGASRDWDIFAPLAISLTLFTSIVVLERFRTIPGKLTVFVFFIIGLHTVPWIGINASKEKSLNRFINIKNDKNWSNYARGHAYDQLRSYFLNLDNTPLALNFSILARKTDPGNIRYMYNLATLFIYDNPLKAQQLFKQVLQKKPDHLFARFNLGTFYAKRDKLKSAEKEFLKAIQIDSTYTWSYYKLADIYRLQKRFAESETSYKKFIVSAPNEYSAYRDLARLYIDLGEKEKAKDILGKSIEMGDDPVESYNYLGNIYFMEGNYLEALRLFEKCVYLAPTNLDSRHSLAITLKNLGKMDQALHHLYYILKRNNNDIKSMNNIGAIYSIQGKFRDAIRMFKRALKLKPKDSDIHINCSSLYYHMGEYKLSWKHILLAEKLNADIPEKLLLNLLKEMKRPTDKKPLLDMPNTLNYNTPKEQIPDRSP